MDLTMPAAALAWLTLLGAPITALLVRFRSRISSTTLATRAGIVLAVVVFAWLLSVDFAWRLLDWFALAVAYLAWAVLIGTAFAIRPAPLGKLLGVVGFISFVPGLLLGTIGFLGLLFIVGEYADAPARSTTLAPGTDCIITNWGSAVSDDGHDVHLYRYLSWFPLLRHQVRRVIVDESNPLPGVPAATGCTEVAAGLVS